MPWSLAKGSPSDSCPCGTRCTQDQPPKKGIRLSISLRVKLNCSCSRCMRVQLCQSSINQLVTLGSVPWPPTSREPSRLQVALRFNLSIERHFVVAVCQYAMGPWKLMGHNKGETRLSHRQPAALHRGVQTATPICFPNKHEYSASYENVIRHVVENNTIPSVFTDSQKYAHLFFYHEINPRGWKTQANPTVLSSQFEFKQLTRRYCSLC